MGRRVFGGVTTLRIQQVFVELLYSYGVIRAMLMRSGDPASTG